MEEASKIYGRLNDMAGQAYCLQRLARLLYGDDQLDAAEEAASRAVDLLADGGDQFDLCRCYRVLGDVCCSKGEVEKAISHFEAALGIASSLNLEGELFLVDYSLARLYFGENKLDEAHAYVERSKSHGTDQPLRLGHAMKLQADFWFRESKFEEAKSEALRALDVYQKFGVVADMGACRELLQDIENKMKVPVTSG